MYSGDPLNITVFFQLSARSVFFAAITLIKETVISSRLKIIIRSLYEMQLRYNLKKG